MGLFRRKNKEPEPEKVIQTMNDRQIVTIKCPYCMGVLFEGYYLTIEVDKNLKVCPHCGGKITLS